MAPFNPSDPPAQYDPPETPPEGFPHERVYTFTPWLNVPDDPAFAGIFAECPETTLPAHRSYSLGNTFDVCRVEEGWLATCYWRSGSFDRMAGLIMPGSLIGAAKAINHPGEKMPLLSLTLTPVRMRRMTAVRFREILDADHELWLRFMLSLVHHQEAYLEGMFLMDTSPVPVRLAKLFSILLPLGQNDGDWTALPFSPRVGELALMTHATRPAMSRVVSDWRRRGLIAREGDRFLVARDFTVRVAELLGTLRRFG
ncbi:Crp/Fnr family transcriptional regulator [Sutterella sp.]|uniref:Crp/Fnr family transcriptional regulator n=1 Tax=Sutterella sp. TaxID=1981025 RepID=UPI0026E02A96|nr:Crp/Fnr family transcriptional regulator [Sutterella sp.]MDO5530893.1 Crp/Fnr family transcriptional regulator [Sutterella sp.]